MYRRSSIRLCELVFRCYSMPTSSSSLLKPLASLSNQCSSEAFSLLVPKKSHYFVQSLNTSASAQMKNFRSLRLYSVETDKEVDKINLKFAEAREEIESALESKETLYFDEEAECARSAVDEVLNLYEGLLAKLPDDEKGAIQRSMGLKIEQLKAELAQLDE